jgi:hypothetical protein
MNVQLPVQLPCNMRAASVSATPRLPIWEWHAHTRAAHSPHGIGVRWSHRQGRNSPRYAVVRVDIQGRTDRTRTRAIASGAARVRDSFSVLGRTRTAATPKTHQRVPQRVCVSDRPRRFQTSNMITTRLANAVLRQYLTCPRSTNSLCCGHIGRVCGRALSHEQNNSWKQTRARGQTVCRARRLRNVGFARCAGDRPAKAPGGGGGGGKLEPAGISTYRPTFAAGFLGIFEAFIPIGSRGYVMKKLPRRGVEN